MLTEFQFLGQDVAKRIVVENPNKVADLCEDSYSSKRRFVYAKNSWV